MAKVDDYKYMGSTVKSNGECETALLYRLETVALTKIQEADMEVA